MALLPRPNVSFAQSLAGTRAQEQAQNQRVQDFLNRVRQTTQNQTGSIAQRIVPSVAPPVGEGGEVADAPAPEGPNDPFGGMGNPTGAGSVRGGFQSPPGEFDPSIAGRAALFAAGFVPGPIGIGSNILGAGFTINDINNALNSGPKFSLGPPSIRSGGGVPGRPSRPTSPVQAIPEPPVVFDPAPPVNFDTLVNAGPVSGQAPASNTGAVPSSNINDIRASVGLPPSGLTGGSGGDSFGGSTVSEGPVSGQAPASNTGPAPSSNISDISASVGGGGGGGPDKIVCTAMNETYGFGSFRNAIWLKYAENMTKEHEVGYHRIFKPIIRYYSGGDTKPRQMVRRVVEHLMRRRTRDIRREMRGTKRNWLDRIGRGIAEPICWLVGKF